MTLGSIRAISLTVVAAVSCQFINTRQLFAIANPVKDYTLHEFKDFNGKVQMSITSHGTGKFMGPIESSMGTSTFSDVSVKKDIILQGNLIASKNINVEGNLETSTLIVQKDLQAGGGKFKGAVAVTDLVATGSLKVLGEVEFLRDLKVKSSFGAGTVDVNGNLNAKTIKISGDAKVGSMFSEGSIKSVKGFQTDAGDVKCKDFESKGDANILGLLKGRDALFTGVVSATKKIDSDLIEVRKISIAKEVVISDQANMKIQGKMNVVGDAKFVHGLASTGDIVVKGLIDVDGTLKAEDMIINGKSSTHELYARESIETKILKVSDINVSEKITANSINGKTINVRGESSFHHVTANSVEVNRAFSVTGSFSAVSMRIDGDSTIQGTTTSNRAIVKESLKASNITVSGVVQARTISCTGDLESKRIKSASIESSGVVAAKELRTNGLFVNGTTKFAGVGADHIISNTFKVKNHLETYNGTVLKDFVVGRSLVVAGNVNVSAHLKAKNIAVDNDLSVQKNIKVKNVHVFGEVAIDGKLRGTSAEFNEIVKVSSLDVKENLICATSSISGKLEVGGNATISSLVVSDGQLIAKQDIFCENNIHVNESLIAKKLSVIESINASKIESSLVVVKKGHIYSSGGFYTDNGNISCSDALVSGSINVQGGMTTGSITSVGSIHTNESITAQSSNIHGMLLAQNLSVSHSALIHGQLESNGGIICRQNMSVLGNMTIGGDIKGQGIEIDGAIKSKVLFSSRIYTEDVAASGFISASAITSKGDATVRGEITAGKAKISQTIQTTDLEVRDSISSTTATVAGTMTTAGLVAQKVTVSKILSVDGINIMDIVKQVQAMQIRLEEIEELVQIIS